MSFELLALENFPPAFNHLVLFTAILTLSSTLCTSKAFCLDPFVRRL